MSEPNRLTRIVSRTRWWTGGVVPVAAVLAATLASVTVRTSLSLGADAPAEWPVVILAVDDAGVPVDQVVFDVRTGSGALLTNRRVDQGGRLELSGVRDPRLVVGVQPDGPGDFARRPAPEVDIVGVAPPPTRVVVDLKPLLLVDLVDPSGTAVPASMFGPKDGLLTPVCSLHLSDKFEDTVISVASAGKLQFRRIRRNRPWVLFVPWSERWGGTALLKGDRLGEGPMTVRLESGAEIKGRIDVTVDPTPPIGRQRIWAMQGQARADGSMLRDGSFMFPRMPKGKWHLTAIYSCGGRGCRTEFDVEAGEVDVRVDSAGLRLPR